MSKKLKPIVKAKPVEAAVVEPEEKEVINVCNGALCKTNEPFCKTHSTAGHVCTLPKGHKGNHVACGSHKHNIISWK